jgi:hypothetical protein
MAASLQAQQVIVPRASHLVAGRSRAFQVRMAGGSPGGGRHLPAGDWSWTILDGGVGALDEATGVYAAPPVEQPTLVRIRAAWRPWPEWTAQALVLVLPFQPFDLLDKVDPHWLAPFSWELPYWDPVTDSRTSGVEAETRHFPRLLRSPHAAAYGLPSTLRWKSRAGDLRLTLVEGGEAIRMDVSGKVSQELTLRGRVQECTVERLQRVEGREDGWQSDIQHFRIHLRGLLPFAGNALTEPGHGDGPGLSARFQEPFGLAKVSQGESGSLETAYLVSDVRSHVIRCISSQGEVTTPWGCPGHAGHQDAVDPSGLRLLASALCGRRPDRRPESLFNRPTHLLVHVFHEWNAEARWAVTWKCYVADSGNHVIRVVHPDGTTGTQAGTPGQAGHRDAGSGSSALFKDPQGLARDDDGFLYVADRGNQVIRVITPRGGVRTLAGSPGRAGSLDGTGAAARFTDLKGMAYVGMPGEPGVLYVADGHAIRRIDLPGGEVTTVVGVVETRGFQDCTGDFTEARRKAIRQPCLDNPCGILRCREDVLVIADQGNNSVRIWSPRRVLLETEAGDPGLRETRWGLLRAGMEESLDERYAALDAPRTLVQTDVPESFLVTSGCCLGELAPAYGEEELGVDLETFAASSGQTCAVRFVPTIRHGGASVRTIHYSVDFIEADGTLAEHQKGTGTEGVPVSVQGTLFAPGEASVVVRCVTDHGLSTGIQGKIQVQ